MVVQGGLAAIWQKVRTLGTFLLENVSFWIFRIQSFVPFQNMQHCITYPSKLFDSREIECLNDYTRKMMASDQRLFKRLSDKRIQGIRAWEYGQLLSLVDMQWSSKNWLVLDVGPGNSAFPTFLASHVRRIITIDYPDPLERPSAKDVRKSRRAGIRLIHGTMLGLPFPSDIFDLVTCISTIEHLDDPGTGEQIPYDQFIRLTEYGVREMARVTQPGGYIYLTTDAYIPELQKTDAWSAKRRDRKSIWSAYHIGDIQTIFLDVLKDVGFDIVGEGNFDRESLLRDPARSNYRGRYFTTFCIFARRAL